MGLDRPIALDINNFIFIRAKHTGYCVVALLAVYINRENRLISLFEKSYVALNPSPK